MKKTTTKSATKKPKLEVKKIVVRRLEKNDLEAVNGGEVRAAGITWD